LAINSKRDCIIMCGRARYSTRANQRVRQYARRGGQGSGNQASHASSSGGQSHQAPNDSLTRQSSAENDQEQGFGEVENICPGMRCPVLVRLPGEDHPHVEEMVWGLIPMYSSSSEKGNHFQLFNKRIESFETGTSTGYFHKLIASKRCVILFDGFYEWKLIAGKKQPYYVYLEDSPMLLAGFFEDSTYVDYSSQKSVNMRTFTILTSDPCHAFEEIHNRQPVMMTEEQMQQWLDPTMPNPLSFLTQLKSNHVDETLPINHQIRFHPVAKKMTDMKYQGVDCAKPISLGMNMTSFFKQQQSPSTAAAAAAAAAAAVVLAEDKDVSSVSAVVGQKRSIKAVDLTADDDNDISPYKTVKREVPSSSGPMSKFLSAPAAATPSDDDATKKIAKVFPSPAAKPATGTGSPKKTVNKKTVPGGGGGIANFFRGKSSDSSVGYL